MADYKLSIIMPNYNGEAFLEKAILSFVDNKYEKKELVIVDGKSSDASHAIIKRYADEFNSIRWCKENDSGISDAINKGLALVTGDIIGYLGSDDILNSKTLDYVNSYKKIVDFDGIYFDSYTYDYETNTVKLRKCPQGQFNEVNLIKSGTIVGLQNIFFDKKVYLKHKYDTQNKYSMDYEIYLRIVQEFTNFLYVEYPATINIFHDNISNRLEKIQTKEALGVMGKYVSIKNIKHLPFKRLVCNWMNLLK